jgi:hypothetical protein
MAEMTSLGEGSGGVHVSRFVDIRHRLTAIIKFNLYGAGDRDEGRAALLARDRLDDFIFHARQSNLVGGRIEETDVLKRAIILETFGELLDILDHAHDAGGGTSKGVRAEMQKLRDDPDRFDRFNDVDKAAIQEMACGLAIFVKSRFRHLHEGLRRRAGQFMG